MLSLEDCLELQIEVLFGAPGWLSWISIRLLISAQVIISGSWDLALCQAPHSARSLLDILSLSLPLCLSPLPTLSLLSLSLNNNNFKSTMEGRLGGTAVGHLPSAQGVIPGSWDRAPHQAPPLQACFFLSHSPCLCSLYRWLSLSLSNK